MSQDKIAFEKFFPRPLVFADKAHELEMISKWNEAKINWETALEAVTTEANKRIAELELEVQNWKDFCKKVQKVDFNDYLALESEVAELQRDRDEWKDSTISANRRFEIAENDVYKYQVETANMSLEIMQLQKNNHDLREALETIATESHYELWQVQVATKALSATPAESLQAFENEVIEKCANAIDEMVTVYTKNCDKYKAIGDKESTERNVNKGRAAISCAEVIRALKGK